MLDQIRRLVEGSLRFQVNSENTPIGTKTKKWDTVKIILESLAITMYDSWNYSIFLKLYDDTVFILFFFFKSAGNWVPPVPSQQYEHAPNWHQNQGMGHGQNNMRMRSYSSYNVRPTKFYLNFFLWHHFYIWF